MKPSRIIAQEIAKVLREDTLAAAALKQEFANESELMTLLDLTETVNALKEMLAERDESVRLLKYEIDGLYDQLDHA